LLQKVRKTVIRADTVKQAKEYLDVGDGSVLEIELRQ
jgi:hypothetical protein